MHGQWHHVLVSWTGHMCYLTLLWNDNKLDSSLCLYVTVSVSTGLFLSSCLCPFVIMWGHSASCHMVATVSSEFLGVTSQKIKDFSLKSVCKRFNTSTNDNLNISKMRKNYLTNFWSYLYTQIFLWINVICQCMYLKLISFLSSLNHKF